MRLFLGGLCLASMLFVTTGCEGSKEAGPPVATTQDEFEAYDKLVEGDQEQTAKDTEEAEE